MSAATAVASAAVDARSFVVWRHSRPRRGSGARRRLLHTFFYVALLLLLHELPLRATRGETHANRATLSDSSASSSDFAAAWHHDLGSPPNASTGSGEREAVHDRSPTSRTATGGEFGWSSDPDIVTVLSARIQPCDGAAFAPTTPCRQQLVVYLSVQPPSPSSGGGEGGATSPDHVMVNVTHAEIRREPSATAIIPVTPFRIDVGGLTLMHRHTLEYIKEFNAKPYEAALPSATCDASMDPARATCGVAMDLQSNVVPYSSGFCCDCSRCSERPGGCTASWRANACAGQSTHVGLCLRQSTNWYSGFNIRALSAPWYNFTIHAEIPQLVETSTPNVFDVHHPTLDLFVNPTSSSVSSTSREPALLGPRLRVDTAPTPRDGPLPMLAQRLLFTPSQPSGDERVRAGVREWMFILRDMVSIEGDVCDRVGTSYEAFVRQEDRCFANVGSCLSSQLEDLRGGDLWVMQSGLPGVWMAPNFGDFQLVHLPDSTPSSPLPFTPSLAYPTVAREPAVLRLVMNYDNFILAESVRPSGYVVLHGVRRYPRHIPLDEESVALAEQLNERTARMRYFYVNVTNNNGVGLTERYQVTATLPQWIGGVETSTRLSSLYLTVEASQILAVPILIETPVDYHIGLFTLRAELSDPAHSIVISSRDVLLRMAVDGIIPNLPDLDPIYVTNRTTTPPTAAPSGLPEWREEEKDLCEQCSFFAVQCNFEFDCYDAYIYYVIVILAVLTVAGIVLFVLRKLSQSTTLQRWYQQMVMPKPGQRTPSTEAAAQHPTHQRPSDSAAASRARRSAAPPPSHGPYCAGGAYATTASRGPVRPPVVEEVTTPYGERDGGPPY